MPKPEPIAGDAGMHGDLSVEVQYADRTPWAPTRAQLSLWAYAANLAASRGRRRRSEPALCIRVVGQAESRRLNRDYRGRDLPTNVLSFPASAAARRLDGSLGDLVVCAAVVAREARAQRKARTAHWAHMVVHGVLHLHGYDHEGDADARRMERREVEILGTFGYHDPYRPRLTHPA